MESSHTAFVACTTSDGTDVLGATVSMAVCSMSVDISLSAPSCSEVLSSVSDASDVLAVSPLFAELSLTWPVASG